jgi:hypothetical protein
MQGMPWSWDELQATPAYVQRYCHDFLAIQAEHERAAAEKAARQRGG